MKNPRAHEKTQENPRESIDFEKIWMPSYHISKRILKNKYWIEIREFPKELRESGRICKNPGECERIWKNLKESEGKEIIWPNSERIRNNLKGSKRIRENQIESEGIRENMREFNEIPRGLERIRKNPRTKRENLAKFWKDKKPSGRIRNKSKE